MSVRLVLIVIAIVLFAIRVKYNPPTWDLGWLGMAFFAASFLFGS